MNLVIRFSRFHTFLSSLSPEIRRHRIDILIAFSLVIVGGVASYLGAQWVDPIIAKLQDIWFNADTDRVFDNMTSRDSDHYRVKVHPLFSLIAFPPVFVLEKALHLEPISAVRIVTAAVAALWLGSLFVTLRLLGCRRFDAIQFSLLGATSAASIFWFTVPETYSFGSLSIMLAICFVALTETHVFSWFWYVAVSVLTLSVTITNWMVGILAVAVNHRWRQSLQITVNAFAIVTLLWGVQKYLFPSAVFFLGDREEERYVKVTQSTGEYLTVIKSFFSNTMVMPALQLTANREKPEWPFISPQAAEPGSGSIWGFIAVGLWMALLGLGMWGFFSSKKHPKLRRVLGFSILGQVLLHLLYGRGETFLFSLHFAPLVIIVAAFSTLTRARPIALILAGTLVISAGINNLQLFHQATEYLLNHGAPRSQAQIQMQRRSFDAWPRSDTSINSNFP